MENKVVITQNERTINKHLEDGWLVKSAVAQYISVGGQSRGHEEGDICFVLERKLEEL